MVVKATSAASAASAVLIPPPLLLHRETPHHRSLFELWCPLSQDANKYIEKLITATTRLQQPQVIPDDMLSLSISPRGLVVGVSPAARGGYVPVNILWGGLIVLTVLPQILVFSCNSTTTTREPARCEALAMNCMLPRFMAPSSELLLLGAAWSTSIKGNPSVTPLEFAGVILNEAASAFKANDEGKTAVHVSAEHGDLAVTKLLVRADRPHLPGDEDFRWRRPTPLHLAAHKDTWRL